MVHTAQAELERYARHIVLPQVGGVGQQRLKAARVAVIGAGGVGSAVIPALAGAGIGKLTIIDDEVLRRVMAGRCVRKTTAFLATDW